MKSSCKLMNSQKKIEIFLSTSSEMIRRHKVFTSKAIRWTLRWQRIRMRSQRAGTCIKGSSSARPLPSERLPIHLAAGGRRTLFTVLARPGHTDQAPAPCRRKRRTAGGGSLRLNVGTRHAHNRLPHIPQYLAALHTLASNAAIPVARWFVWDQSFQRVSTR